MWGEAIITVMYLRNLSPTKNLRAIVLYEMWTGKKAYIGYLRVFGCIAYYLCCAIGPGNPIWGGVGWVKIGLGAGLGSGY